MEQNNNEKRQMVKAGAKLALKAASAPIKTLILSVVATILPYILVGLLVFVVIFCVYFGTLEQIDQILVDSEDWGERIGNAVSLYGFKTNEELEKDEEGKYFLMLAMYKKVFDFDNYEISLINQTLLYEGSSEERIYLSEKPDGYDFDNHDDFDIDKSSGIDVFEGKSKIGMFWKFIKNIVTNYQRGFATSVAGQSQYLKANKNMLINAAALKKCSNLTKGDREKEEQCYKGYLIADYNTATDYYIDCNYDKALFCDMDKAIETDVEPGFLVLPNNIAGQTVAIMNNIADIRNDIINQLSKFTIFAGITRKETTIDETIRDSFTLYFLGTLAKKDDIHFYYDGYIVNNLKEEYKIYNNLVYDLDVNSASPTIEEDLLELFEMYDKETIEKERRNRRKTADLINELTETYFDLTYGPNKIEEMFAEIVASNESKASVIIDEDGNAISFDDYVMINALANYSDEIKAIVDSGENVEERLRALMILVRTQIYDETGFNHSSAEVTGNFDIYEAGKEIYDSFKGDSKLYKYLANLSSAIAGSRGRTIKVNGQVVTLTPEQINQILGSVENGGTIEDEIANIIPDASLNVTLFPLPEGSFSISSQYNEDRGSYSHKAFDYAAPEGTKISSISDGVVTSVVSHCTVGDTVCGGGYGNRVYVLYTNGDGNNYYVIYAHMSSTANISVGQTVSAGTLLGYVGNTGDSHGNHLHLEVRKNSTDSNEFSVHPSTIFDMNFGG